MAQETAGMELSKPDAVVQFTRAGPATISSLQVEDGEDENDWGWGADETEYQHLGVEPRCGEALLEISPPLETHLKSMDSNSEDGWC